MPSSRSASSVLPRLKAQCFRALHRRSEADYEIGNPIMMARSGWGMEMAVNESRLPGGVLGGAIYSSHPDDTTGTWRGDAAVLAQIDAWKAAGGKR